MQSQAPLSDFRPYYPSVRPILALNIPDITPPKPPVHKVTVPRVTSPRVTSPVLRNGYLVPISASIEPTQVVNTASGRTVKIVSPIISSTPVPAV